jgi:hypothetical protein
VASKEETRAYQMPSSRRKGEGEIKRDETSTLTTIQPLNVSKATGMQLNECHLLLTPHAAHDACRLTHMAGRGASASHRKRAEGRQAELKRGSKKCDTMLGEVVVNLSRSHPTKVPNRDSMSGEKVQCLILMLGYLIFHPEDLGP